MSYQALFERHVQRSRVSGEQLYGLCCFHQDRKPSFSGNLRTGLWNCKACEAKGNARHFALRVGEDPSPFANGNGQASPREPTQEERDSQDADFRAYWYGNEIYLKEVYDYRSLDGAVILYQIGKFVSLSGERVKWFQQRSPDQTRPDGWNYHQAIQTAGGHVLYRQADIAEADLVYYVEGEADADTLFAHGLTAITHATGASLDLDKRRSMFLPLTGKDVICIPDNDEPGRKMVEKLASVLRGIAASFSIITLPDTPEQEDISWWLAHHTIEEFQALAPEVIFQEADRCTGEEADWSDVEGEAQEPEYRVEDERDPVEEPTVDTADSCSCLDIIWQGSFTQVAQKVGLKCWEVWAGTYAALSAVAHRNLWWKYFGDLFGMAYVLVVSPTGSGKALVTDTCADLLPQHYTVRHGVQSGPGLLPLLTDDSLDNKNGRLTVHGRPVILVCDEWSRLAQVAGVEHSTLIEDINSLFQRRRPYSQSRSNKNRSGGDVVVTDPALSVCGTTTASLFNGCVTARQISGGFLNRHLVLPGRGIWIEYTGESPHTDRLGGLLDALVSHGWGRGQELKRAYSPPAWERFLDLQRHFFKPIMEDPDTSEVMKRLHFYFHHVALIYAWSEKSPAIEMHHLQAAVQVISTSHQFLLALLENQHAHVEPVPFQRRAMGLEQKILAKVAREPGVSRRKVMQDLNKTAGCEELGRCLDSLLKAGLLIGKSAPRGQVFLYPVREKK